MYDCMYVCMYVCIYSCSLVPRPPLFLHSVCIHNSIETSKKWRRPGSIHHVSRRDLEIGEELESEFFYKSRRVVSIMLRSGVQSCSRALEWITWCVLLADGSLTPTSQLHPLLHPPDVIHVMNVARLSGCLPPRVLM